MKFSVDLRGLSRAQWHFFYDCLHELSPQHFCVCEVGDEFITIELNQAQITTNKLLDGTDLRTSLAGLMDSLSQQHPELFMPNAHYAWRTRIIPCLEQKS